MSRVNLLLLALLLASSLALVRTSYEARRLFAELDRAKATQLRLDAEYRRLDAERQTQATHLRVERVAREKLGMRTATPAVVEHVVDPGPGAPAPTPAVGAAGGRR
ncbi:MAG: cell division protein FtsL [Rubrivivax sp.]|nr:cell division protein FtsL [Rubrivivax sp.]